MNKEKARLNNLVDKSVQEEPTVSSMAIQTEFVVPPVRFLRHMVLSCFHTH